MLVTISIILPIFFFQIFDFLYSKNTPNYNPFKLREPLNNGKALYKRDDLGWYDLASDFNGESRYSKNYFFVKTDKNGLRINHLKNNNYDFFLEEKIIFIGDSFTFGVGLDWEKSFVGILNKDFNINAINAGVNSYSPTTYKYKLRSLIDEGLISENQKIVIGLDISDVYDEATRWTEYKGKPATIKEVIELNKNNLIVKNIKSESSLNNGERNFKKFYTLYNKISHQIYFGIERFIKKFVDDIQVRNNDRSKFTHKDWKLIDEKFSPLGIEEGLRKIKANLLEISQILSKNNSELYLLIYPWPAQLAYESHFDWPKYVQEICIEIDCSGVINAFPDFIEYKNNTKFWQKELYLRGDMHFNQKGNFVLAEIIANELNK